MLTTKNLQVKVDPSNGFYQKHNDFQKFHTNRDRYRRKKISLPVGAVPEEDDYNRVVWHTGHIIESRISICPEAAAFFCHLDACPKNLLLYIISHEINSATGEFSWNAQVRHRFSTYCHFFGKTYSNESVRKALQLLTASNCCENKKRGCYIMNPLVVGGTSEDSRHQLLKEYVTLLLTKGKSIPGDLYPRYVAS